MARKSSKINGGFIIIPKNTLKCAEYKALTPATRIVYQTLLTAFIRDSRANPDHKLTITHREIEAISGLGHATVVRSMKALKQSEFISVSKQGGLENNPSEYIMNGRYLW